MSEPAQPRCPHFGTCGGCTLQHLPYEQQLENKRLRLAYLLQSDFTGTVHAARSEPYGYRSRMDFVWTAKGPSQRTQERGMLAARACPISDPRIEALLGELRDWHERTQALEAFDPRRRTGVLKYVTVRAAEACTVVFMLNEDSPRLREHSEHIASFAQQTSAANVLIAYTPAQTDESLSLECYAVKGNEFLTEHFLGIPLVYHAAGFFQNNPRVAEAMVAHVRDAFIAANCAGKNVVDLYGGVGTFAFPLAAHCAHIFSVESYPLAAPCIERTKAASGVPNITAFTEDAGNLQKLNIPSDAWYIVDPPRSGMEPRALRALMQRAPERIAYISCNPAQLAKELVLLRARYRVESVSLFDMFPQTNHSECVAMLIRR